MVEQASNAPASAACDVPAPAPAAGEPALPWWAIWAALLALAAVAAFIAGRLAPFRTGAQAAHQHGQFVPVLAMLVCLLAAGFDVATGHIPNSLTYVAVLAGLGFNCGAAMLARWAKLDAVAWLGAVTPAAAFEGLALCAALTAACLFIGAGMGGGDAKLLMAVGALLGWRATCSMLLWTLIVAVPFALINLAVRGRLTAALRSIAAYLLHAVYLRRFDKVAPLSQTSVPMALIVFLALFIDGMVPGFWWK